MAERDDAQAQVIDVETGQARAIFDKVSEDQAFGFSPDGLQLAGFAENALQLWDVRTGQQIDSIAWESRITSAAFGTWEDGQAKRLILAAGNAQGQVYLIDPQSRQQLKTIQVTDQAVEAVALHPGGHILAAAISENKTLAILLVDMHTGQALRTLDLSGLVEGYSRIFGLTFSLDGEAIAMRTDNFAETGVRAWNIQSGQPLSNPAEKSWSRARKITIGSNGHLIKLDYTGQEDTSGDYEFLDLNTNSSLGSVEVVGPVDSTDDYVALSSDNRYAALSSCSNDISILDLMDHKVTAIPNTHLLPGGGGGCIGGVEDFSFNPYGYLLVSAGYDDTIRFWDASKAQLLLTLTNRTGSVFALSFSPDGRYLASIGWDGFLRLWGIP